MRPRDLSTSVPCPPKAFFAEARTFVEDAVHLLVSRECTTPAARRVSRGSRQRHCGLGVPPIRW